MRWYDRMFFGVLGVVFLMWIAWKAELAARALQLTAAEQGRLADVHANVLVIEGERQRASTLASAWESAVAHHTLSTPLGDDSIDTDLDRHERKLVATEKRYPIRR